MKSRQAGSQPEERHKEDQTTRQTRCVGFVQYRRSCGVLAPGLCVLDDWWSMLVQRPCWFPSPELGQDKNRDLGLWLMPDVCYQ